MRRARFWNSKAATGSRSDSSAIEHSRDCRVVVNTNKPEATMLPLRAVYDEEHDQFRETVRRFAASKIAPNFQRWQDAGIIERSLWSAGGEAGLLCPQVPEELGGAGGDFRHNAIVIEELSYSGFAGPATDFSVHNDVCSGYRLSYGSPEQKKKWLPRMVSGETVCAIA